MDGLALLGIVLVLYAMVLVYLAVKKPPSIWGMAKIKFFIKVFGEKGAVIFFFIFALACAALGIWLIA